MKVERITLKDLDGRTESQSQAVLIANRAAWRLKGVAIRRFVDALEAAIGHRQGC